MCIGHLPPLPRHGRIPYRSTEWIGNYESSDRDSINMNGNQLTKTHALSFAVAVMAFASPAFGQGFRANGMNTNGSVFIDAPRQVQQDLREAERAIAEERLSDAVVALGDLLQRDVEDAADADLAGQDFFLVGRSPRQNARIQMSSLRKARELIESLPPKALETYELRYGAIARKTLSDAAASRDWEAVQSVRRRYFHTKAGFEASYLLAQQEMLTGHPLSASLLLDEVVGFQPAVNHLGTAVVVLHAAACKLADRDLPTDTLESQVEARVLAGGKEETLPSAGKMDQWLERLYASTQQNAGGELSEYRYAGGRPNRNELSAGEMPLSNLRWKLPTHPTPRNGRLVKQTETELLSSRNLPPPSAMPIRVGDTLLLRSASSLYGVDYRTGKRIWQHPNGPFPSEQRELDIPPMRSIGNQSNINSLVAQRVWNDNPFGSVSSDGERAFVIDDLNEVELISISPMMGMRGVRRADNMTNTLVALELATEGKMIWRLGASADEVSNLSDAFFLGAPLPLDGRLYVMAEIAGDIMLVCLDPRTGDEIWRQQLAAVESGSISVDAARRVTGAAPTYHEGVLICPTGAGTIVAIDLVDRMLRWGVSYPRRLNFPQTMNTRSTSTDKSILMRRWHKGTSIAVQDSVYVTPTESDVLMCLDLVDGSRKFADRRRGSSRYVAGIRGGKAIIVGDKSVVAIDAKNGRELWETDRKLLSVSEQISGRGLFGKDDYLIPTSANRLVRISLKDGKLLEERATRFELGNLVAVGGEIISQGPTTLSVAYGEKALVPWIEKMLRSNPDHFEALVRKSELLIHQGKHQAALDLLDRAGKIESESVDVQWLSVAAMLALLRESPEESEHLVPRLEQLVDLPSERVEFLRLQVGAALKKGSYESSFQGLLKLSDLSKDRSAPASAIDEAERRCSWGQWIAARTKEIANLADEDQLKQINNELDLIIQPKLESGNETLQRIVHDFGSLEIQDARKVLCDRYIGSKTFLSAERLLLGHKAASFSDLSGMSTAELLLLAKTLSGGNLDDDAVRVLNEIAKRDGVSDQDAALAGQMRKEAQIESTVDWDDKVALNWESSALATRGIRGLDLGQKIRRTGIEYGESFRGWQLVYQSATLGIRNPLGRFIGLSPRRNEKDREARIYGGVMLLIRPGEVTAVDLYKIRQNQGIESILWVDGAEGVSIASRRSDTSPFGDTFYRSYMNNKDSSVDRRYIVGGVMGDRVILLKGNELFALNVMNRSELWKTSLDVTAISVVCGSDKIALVAENAVTYVDAIDGNVLGKEKFEFGEDWATAGKHVLCFSKSETPGKRNVKLVDPFTRKVVTQTDWWEMQSNTESRGYGRVVNNRYMVLLDTDGNLLVWDIRDGKQVTKEKTFAYADLLDVNAVELQGRLVIIPSRNHNIANTQSNRTTTQHGFEHKTAHALISVALNDGSIQWTREFDKPWGCTLAQPAQTPLLLLNRRMDSYPGTGARKVTMDTTAIDVRNGKALHERLARAVSSRTNELAAKMTVQIPQGRVIAQIGGELLTYKFGETDPVEPEVDPQEAKPAADESIEDLFGNPK